MLGSDNRMTLRHAEATWRYIGPGSKVGNGEEPVEQQRQNTAEDDLIGTKVVTAAGRGVVIPTL